MKMLGQVTYPTVLEEEGRCLIKTFFKKMSADSIVGWDCIPDNSPLSRRNLNSKNRIFQ